jgi:phosphoribosylanthranilate isomerase
VRVRVKICGITNVEDALAAADAGADAIGLVFAESPRRVTLETARRIVSALLPFVCPVGVFVDAPGEEVIWTAGEAGLHCVQLHGDESPDYVRALGAVSVIKAIRAGSREDARRADDYASVILLDTASERAAGGTGETFPWEYAEEIARERPIILGGGLTSGNVAEAIRQVRPWAVDVSSGVERAKGLKDAAEIRRFIESVRRVEDAQR